MDLVSIKHVLYGKDVDKIDKIGDNIAIYNDDCLDVMKKFPDGYIDLTVTSPPYDNLRTYNGNIDQWTFEKFQEIAKQLYRITAEGGVVVWVVGDATIKGDETGSSFRQALYFKECGFNLHDTMIWIKDGGGAVGSNYCYTQNFEYNFILSKGRPKSINLIYDKENLSFGQDKSGAGRRLPSGEIKIESRKPSAQFSRRNNWWYIPPQKGGEHPAVFPEQLASDHITSWSGVGDKVFDPFLGSGTTGIAAHKLGRKFIGAELDAKYYEVSKKRIRDVVQPQQVSMAV